ncbi:MAG: GNAT family N-acetyltransferase [Actinomycetota bacterium]
MIPSLRDLEAAALTTWPAAEVVSLGGWRLRATDGFTGRANSAQVGVDGSPHDLDDRFARVTAFYVERDLPPLVHVPLTHGTLLARIRAGGGSIRSGAEVLVGPVPAGDSIDEVELHEGPAPILDVWRAVNPAAAAHPKASASLLDRIQPPVAFALAHDAAGRPAACGVGTMRGGLFGLAAMATLPAARGQRHARRIVAALSGWAGGHSATTCWLQVAPDNHAALGLYRSLGLRRSYGYVYAELGS